MNKTKNKPTTFYCFSLLIIVSLILSKVTLAEKFSIVVIPDTQYYTENDQGIFAAQTQWVADNKNNENIIYVAHLGDIVDSNCSSSVSGPEWFRADTAMKILDAINPSLAYGVLPGNHDYDPPGPCNTATARQNYNQFFGRSRFPSAGTSFYGGSDDGITNDNNFTLFESPSRQTKFIAINFAYSNVSASTELINWADDLLKQYADRQAIITAHFFVTGGPESDTSSFRGPHECRAVDELATFGGSVWDGLKNNSNIFMILSGHCLGERWVNMPGGGADRPEMGDVDLLLSNYQEYNSGNSGYLRIMRFDTIAGTIAVETFSVVTGRPLATDGNANTMNNTSVTNFVIQMQMLSPPLPPQNLGIEVGANR